MICRGCGQDFPDDGEGGGLIFVSKSTGVLDFETKKPVEDRACCHCISKAKRTFGPANGENKTTA